MELVKKERCELYDLSEIQIEGVRHYKRAPFPDDLSNTYESFNGDFNEDELDNVLCNLTEATYGEDNYSFYIEITDDTVRDNGNLRITIKNDERLEIQDITPRILDLSKDTRLFILVNEQLTEYKWVVADPKGTVYLG